MPRKLHCRTGIALFAVAAVGMGTARAHQMLYDQDGYKLAVSKRGSGASRWAMSILGPAT